MTQKWNEIETKASRLLLFAWIETEKRLPAEAKALIEKYDAKIRCETPRPWPRWLADADAVELDEMVAAIKAHPLACIPWEMRCRSNMAMHEEWKKENAK